MAHVSGRCRTICFQRSARRNSDRPTSCNRRPANRNALVPRRWRCYAECVASRQRRQLEVAPMEDERRSPGTVTISALPSRRAEGREPWPADRAPHLRSPTFAGLRAPADEFPVAVRLSSDGGVLEDRGDAEELVGLAAYGVHLAEQIGGLLGLQRFVALEYPWHDAGRLVI